MFIDYGSGEALTNERLLLEYGFTLEDHPHDTLELPFGVMVGLAVEDAETGGDGARGTADPSLALEDGGQGELARLAARQQAPLAELEIWKRPESSSKLMAHRQTRR